MKKQKTNEKAKGKIQMKSKKQEARINEKPR